MKVAYLIDREGLGGGQEYIRLQSARDLAHGDEPHTFFSSEGACTATNLNHWGADLVVVNHLRALLQLFANPFRRPHGRVRFVVHGLHLRKYDWLIAESPALPIRFILHFKRLLRRNLERQLYHRCDEIVTLTESDRRDVLALYGAQLHVVVEPLTLEGWQPNPATTLPNGLQGPFDYLCIGRFDYAKGQDRWLHKLAALPNSPRTLFIGDGPTLAHCRTLATDLGLTDRCVFAGAIPEADRYLQLVPTILSPSRWEGMPYLLMKARALGCRILATDCPGNRDVLANYANWEKLEL